MSAPDRAARNPSRAGPKFTRLNCPVSVGGDEIASPL
jgi:hypothetical protein